MTIPATIIHLISKHAWMSKYYLLGILQHPRCKKTMLLSSSTIKKQAKNRNLAHSLEKWATFFFLFDIINAI